MVKFKELSVAKAKPRTLAWLPTCLLMAAPWVLATNVHASSGFSASVGERDHTEWGHCVDLTITNSGSSAGIWSVSLELPADQQLANTWNMNVSTQGQKLSLAPSDEVIAYWSPVSSYLQPGQQTPQKQFGYCVSYTSTDPSAGEDFTVAEHVKSEWDTGYCADLTITNNSSSTRMWDAKVDVPAQMDVIDSWNVELHPELYGNALRLRPQAAVQHWNDGNYTLAPGKSTAGDKFGYCVERKKVAAKIKLTSKNEAGYCASVRLKNTTGEPLTQWQTTIKTYGSIANAENLRFTNDGNGFSTIRSADNQTLEPAGSIEGSYCAQGLIGRDGNPTSGTEWRSAGTGIARNLFVEWGIASEQEVSDRLQRLYDQYFTPGGGSRSLTTKILCNQICRVSPMFINAWDSDDVRSEGISYGMMIALMMDRRDDFDALWQFANQYMRGHAPGYPNYFAWHVSNQPPYQVLDPNPAPDAEEYIVTALLAAENKWGSSGAFNYRDEAETILGDMLHFSVLWDTQALSMFDVATTQIVFSPVGDSRLHTDPSYHLPWFYDYWGKNLDMTAWADRTAAASRDLFVAAAHPETGLYPEYSHFDGRPIAVSFNAVSQHSVWDAYRVIQNMAVDYYWVSQDERLREQARKVMNFYYQEVAEGRQLRAGYDLEGNVLPRIEDWDFPSMHAGQALYAMLAVGAMVEDEPTEVALHWLQSLWDRNEPQGEYRYYNAMLYMLGMLHVSGEFVLP